MILDEYHETGGLARAAIVYFYDAIMDPRLPLALVEQEIKSRGSPSSVGLRRNIFCHGSVGICAVVAPFQLNSGVLRCGESQLEGNFFEILTLVVGT